MCIHLYVTALPGRQHAPRLSAIINPFGCAARDQFSVIGDLN